MTLLVSNLPSAIKPAYDEATGAQGPGVGAESAKTQGGWGRKGPPQNDRGAQGKKKGKKKGNIKGKEKSVGTCIIE